MGRDSRTADRVLGFVSSATTGQLAMSLIGGYLALVVCFATAYVASQGLSANSVAASLYYSFLVQATGGFGDVHAINGVAKTLTALQISVGVAVLAIAPAILVIRLLAPSRRSLVIDPTVVFYPRDRHFRFRYVSRSRLVGMHGHLRVAVKRRIPDATHNSRNFRVKLANGGEIPNCHSMVPYMARTVRCETTPDEPGTDCFDLVLHPAHISVRPLTVEACFEYPFTSNTVIAHIPQQHIRCGEFLPMSPGGSQADLTMLGEYKPIGSTPEGRSFCTTSCDFRPTCRLHDRVPR